jgi:hypothetical protein
MPKKAATSKKKSIYASPWIIHVNEFRKMHPELSYKEALKEAKKSYTPPVVCNASTIRKRITPRTSQTVLNGVCEALGIPLTTVLQRAPGVPTTTQKPPGKPKDKAPMVIGEPILMAPSAPAYYGDPSVPLPTNKRAMNYEIPRNNKKRRR